MTEKEFADKCITLSFEFDKYLINHPDIAGQIPKGANIFFDLEDDPEFTKKEKELANKLKRKGEPFVIVKVERLIPPFESRLVNTHIEYISSAI